MKLNQILLAEFIDEMNTTRKFLNSISEELFEFSPHEKSKNFGQLILSLIHI